MKKYTKENISNCLSRYVYGPTYYYKEYIIKEGRIEGINKKNKSYYIDIGSDFSHLKEVRKIGNNLYYLLENDLCPFKQQDEISGSVL